MQEEAEIYKWLQSAGRNLRFFHLSGRLLVRLPISSLLLSVRSQGDLRTKGEGTHLTGCKSGEIHEKNPRKSFPEI